MKSAPIILVLSAVVLAALAQSALAQNADSQQGVIGTYVGRKIGRGASQTVTIQLMPHGRATVAVAYTPGGYAMVSTGTWKELGPSEIVLNIAGNAGTGVVYFTRSGDTLTQFTTNTGLLSGFPLQLVRQSPISGIYTAVRSGPNLLQTLTLRLGTDHSATLTVEQTTPKASPVAWAGTWRQMPSGEVRVLISGVGGSQELTLRRTGSGILTTSDWNRAAWGPTPLVFART